MRNCLLVFAVLGAVATAAHAQAEEPKKPSMVCKDGVCSEPVPPKATAAATAASSDEYPNLKFGVYGIADLALLYRDNVPNDPKNLAAGRTQYLNFISGGRNQSRIGLRGSYEIEPGFRALILLEKGFNYNDGTCEDGPLCDPLQFFNRGAYLGLEKDGLGRFTAGRQLTSMYDTVIQFDPLGYSPAFSWLPTAGSGDPSTGAINAGRYGTRVDRMIKYLGRFPGLYLNAYYALGDSTTAIATNSKFGGGAIVRVGPASLLGVYDQRNFTVNALGLQKEQVFVFSVKANLGVIVPVVGWRHFVRTTTTVGDELFFAGVTFRATEKLSFTIADYFDKKQDGSRQNENLFVLRANYFIAKIVETYATYGHASAINGGLAGVMRANDVAPVSSDQNGFALGFRIRFGYPPAASD